MTNEEIFKYIYKELTENGWVRYGWITINRKGEIRLYGRIIARKNIVLDIVNLVMEIITGEKKEYKIQNT